MTSSPEPTEESSSPPQPDQSQGDDGDDLGPMSSNSKLPTFPESSEIVPEVPTEQIETEESPEEEAEEVPAPEQEEAPEPVKDEGDQELSQTPEDPPEPRELPSASMKLLLMPEGLPLMHLDAVPLNMSVADIKDSVLQAAEEITTGPDTSSDTSAVQGCLSFLECLQDAIEANPQANSVDHWSLIVDGVPLEDHLPLIDSLVVPPVHVVPVEVVFASLDGDLTQRSIMSQATEGSMLEEDEEDEGDENLSEHEDGASDRPHKPFLGGYRHIHKGTEYHHAVAQTLPTEAEREAARARAAAKAYRAHRETQTVETRTRSTSTLRESSTQVARPGIWLDKRGDRIVTPRPYFDSNQNDALREAKAVTIQRYVRGWFARNQATVMRQDIVDKRAAVAAAEESRKSEAETLRQKEILRRMQPKTPADFDILYRELEAWRFQETMRINNSELPESERLAALAELLRSEIALMQKIDRLKASAANSNRDSKINRVLELMSAPKKWAMSNGDIAQVHTPFTTRATELKDLYNGLKLPLLTVDERLDVLFHVKWTVKEFDCNLTRDIAELVDREADLLHRGRPEKAVEGLRTRLANLFLQFIETPEFNPEAARFQKVPIDLISRPNTKPIPPRASSRMVSRSSSATTR